MPNKEDRLNKLLSQIQDLRIKIKKQLNDKKLLELRLAQILGEISEIEKEFDNDVINFPRNLSLRLKSKEKELKNVKNEISKREKLVWGTLKSKRLGMFWVHEHLVSKFKKICISNSQVFELLLEKSSDRYLEELEKSIKHKYSDFKPEPNKIIQDLEENDFDKLMLTVQEGMIDRTEELILYENNENVLNEEIEKTLLIFNKENSRTILSTPELESKSLKRTSIDSDIERNPELEEISDEETNERPKIINLINEYCELNRILLNNENLTALAKHINSYAIDKGWHYSLDSIRVTLVNKRANE